MKTIFLPLFLVLMTGCGPQDVTPSPLEGLPATLCAIQSGIIETTCIKCHTTEAPEGGLVLEAGLTFGNLVDVDSKEAPGMARIVPYSLEDSYLWHKVEGSHLGVGGEGAMMPIGMPQLGGAARKLWDDWILDGAQDCEE